MRTCRCGAALPPSAAYCTACGTPTPWSHPQAAWPAPTPARRPWPWLLAGVACMLVIGLGTVVAVVLLRPAPQVVAGPNQISYLPSSPVARDAPTSSSTPTTSRPRPTVPTYATSPSYSSEALDTIAATDAPALEAVVGDWVPQLSSKSAGPSADDAALSDHEALRSRYSSARSLLSDDRPVFRAPGYWVTVVAQPFPTAEAANAWCDLQGIGADDCFAKRLSHVAGPDGATVHR